MPRILTASASASRRHWCSPSAPAWRVRPSLWRAHGDFRETNIVRFRLKTVDAGALVEAAHSEGPYLLLSGTDGVRAVFYVDIYLPRLKKQETS